MYAYFFNSIELFAFILPALPESIYWRLFILFCYFLAHHYKLQYTYLKIKNQYILEKNKEE